MKAEGVKPFRMLLEKNKILSFLDISGNAIGKEGLSYVMQGLRENKSLISLKISKNDIPGECLNDFFRTIKYTKISELDLSGNPIGSQSNIDGLNELANCYELKILNFSDCSLTVLGLEALFVKLNGKNINLLVLILDKNDFRECRCEAMTEFISLISCNLGFKGVRSLCNGLKSNKSIIDLNLARNSLDDECGELISQLLCIASCQIKNLDLNDNKIGEEGGVHIANSLLTNHNLRSLNLKGNSIQFKGGKEFLNCLINSESSILTSLNLTHNPVGCRLEQEIDDVLIDIQSTKEKTTSIKIQIAGLEIEK